MPVIAGEFLAQIDDGEIDEAPAGFAAVVFGAIHQTPAEALLLAQWIDGEKTEIGSFALALPVDASGKGIGILQEEKLSGCEFRSDFSECDAVTFEKEPFGGEGGIDQGSERWGVTQVCDAGLHLGLGYLGRPHWALSRT